MESTLESQPESNTDNEKERHNTEWQTVKAQEKEDTRVQGQGDPKLQI